MILGGGGGMKGAGRPTAGGGGGAGAIPYVTEREFEQAVLLAEMPVLVEFTAEWSQPSKQIAPEVEAFATEVEGKVRVVRVDIDKSQFLARQLRIQSVPTFMLFAEQRVVDAQAGPLGKKQLRTMVEPVLPRSAGAIKPKELAVLLKEGGFVPVDTRDASAFGRAHLPGAKHMPLEELEGRLAELYMIGGQPVLYCRSGDKTKDLCEKLTEQGVPVAYVEGGLLGWEGEGLPVERP